MRLLLSLPLLAVAVPVALAVGQSYPDVDRLDDSWRAIEYLRETRVMTGNPDGAFRPDAPLNRAELMKILVGHAEDVDGGCFPDVPADAWYAPFVCFAAGRGWVKGYPDGLFRPEMPVNGAEALKMLIESRGYEIERFRGRVPDPADQWYQPYAETAIIRGIYSGIYDYELAEPFTRRRAAELLYRAEFSEGSLAYEVETGDCDDKDEIASVRLQWSFSKEYDDGTVQMRQDVIGTDADGRECVAATDINPFDRVGREWRYQLAPVHPRLSVEDSYDFESDIPVVDGAILLRGICECDGAAPRSTWRFDLRSGWLSQIGTFEADLVTVDRRFLVWSDGQELLAYDVRSADFQRIESVSWPTTLVAGVREGMGLYRVEGDMSLRGSVLTYSVYDAGRNGPDDIAEYEKLRTETVDLATLFSR